MSLGGGPTVQAKPVDVFLLVDVSGSMAADGKIQSLNAALEESLPFLRESAAGLVGIDPQMRVLTFSTTAHWVGAAVPLADFWWRGLSAEPQGLTEMGAALHAVKSTLDEVAHALPPAIVLLTDGMPTDTTEPSYADALQELDAHPVGRASSRAAVAIGPDADRQALDAFVASSGGEVLSAHNPEQLANLVRVAGSSVLRSASEPIW